MVFLLHFKTLTPVMVMTRWAQVLVVCSVLSQPYVAQTRFTGSYNELTNEEITIDQLEKALLENAGKYIKKNTEETKTSLKEKELEDAAESKMPFAVPPSDRRFFMSAASLRGDTYNGKEPHSMGSAHYQLPQQVHQPVHQQVHQPMLPDHPHYHYQYQYHNPNYPLHQRIMPAMNAPLPDYGPAWQSPPVYHGQPQIPAADAETVSYLRQSEHFADPSKYVVRPVGGDGVNALSDFYFVALVTGCTVFAVFSVIGLGMCYFRMSKNKRDASDAEYPAYGVTGPNKEVSPGAADRKLAQSAHMYHYQHQKQQMIAIEKSSGDDRHCSTSDVDSEEEGDEGHYTVYECPGLAPTGEMEVKNPLFTDEPTPASPVANGDPKPQQ